MGENEDQDRMKIVISKTPVADGEEEKEVIEEPMKNKLDVLLPPARSRSPVTVQDWIASLPDKIRDEEGEESSSESSDDDEVRDTLILGAEGKKGGKRKIVFIT